MNILIIGCGNLGSVLANEFDRNGHDVSVVDENPDRIHLLHEDFDGLFVTGIAMDMDVLRDAGVESCDAVAVVTSDDNLNITVSQIVKKFFGVENVITRITNSYRENAFKNKFGLKTICQTNISANTIYSAIIGGGDNINIANNSNFMIDSIKVDDKYVGRAISALPLKDGASLVGIKRKSGKVLIYDLMSNIEVESGDTALYIREG